MKERICSGLFHSKEEGKRLRRIRVCERKQTGGVTSSSPERNAVDGSMARVRETLTLSPSGRRGHLKGMGQWKQVPAQGDRTTPPSLPFLSRWPCRKCMKVCNIRVRQNSWSLPRTSQSVRWITTLGVKKEREVIVGDSLCRETEGPICQLDPFHRQVCCLLGTWVRHVIRRLPGLIEPSDYYQLLVVQVGSDKVDERSLMAVKKNLRALGQQIDRNKSTGGVFLKSFGSREENAERNTELT